MRGTSVMSIPVPTIMRDNVSTWASAAATARVEAGGCPHVFMLDLGCTSVADLYGNRGNQRNHRCDCGRRERELPVRDGHIGMYAAPITRPIIPSRRQTAKASSVSKNVTSSTRSGTQNQRSFAEGTLEADISFDCSGSQFPVVSSQFRGKKPAVA